MSNTQLSEVRHDYIRYANVWEDADILLKGLRATPGQRCLSIASACDNALMLLTTDPELVVAVDINSAQIRLCRLKIAAIRVCTHAEYLTFWGFEPDQGQRPSLTTRVLAALPEADQQYWSAHGETTHKGLVHGGKFERYFRLFAHYILPFIHTKKLVNQLLTPKSAEAQSAFYHQHWNTWRWRLLFRIFFSKYVMGKAGRDPAFLEQVKVPVASFIFNKAEAHLQSELATQNHILRYNLTGTYGSQWPDYVHPVHYEHIKRNLDRLVLHEGLAESAFEQYGNFDCFNLSNIFEYMDEPTFKAVAESLARGAHAGARFCYWNLMAPRNMAEILPDIFEDDAELSEQLTKMDKGFFYNKFIISTLCKEK